jgi:prolyl-tRNA editing enzyme YbaK/EbsC (Cys-tRNA(Pro) deacylase)
LGIFLYNGRNFQKGLKQMSIEQVRDYLKRWNRDTDIIEMEASTATVLEAANALGVIPARIAKSISLRQGGGGAPGADSPAA